MSRICAQLQGLLLEEGTLDMCEVYTMSQKDFLAYNDAAHVVIEKHDEQGNITMSVSLYDLVKAYISEFGGEDINKAMDAIFGEGKYINADLIFIIMVLFTESRFGLFFTGKFRYNGEAFSIQEITELVTRWVERAWSFWHFENIIDQRLFYAALLVRMELAVNFQVSWAQLDARLRDFFSNPRAPEDPFEQLFIDWCYASTRHIEMALEFSAFGKPDHKASSHVPIASAILAFAMSRRVPDYLTEGKAWILSYFHGIDFHYAGRLNVVYKPERKYEIMEEIRRNINNAVANHRAYAESVVARLEAGLDEHGERLPKRIRRSPKYHNNLRQKKKDLKILDGRCGYDENNNVIPDEKYNGYIGEDARELREKEIRATVARNSYIYTRILDSFPLMNRISNIKEIEGDNYQVSVQLYSNNQYAKEVNKIYAQCQEELKAVVEAEMSMRRRLRAVFLAQQSGQIFNTLTEAQKEELTQRAEREMRISGEWDRLEGTTADKYLHEQFAKIKAEDARVNYTINIAKELIENPTDFSNTALQMAAIIPGVQGLYINERVRRGVLRIYRGRQKTFAQYKEQLEAMKKVIEKAEHVTENVLKEAGKQ